MKRIQPTKHYNEDCGYPSVADIDLSRRGFLGAAAAAAAATAAAAAAVGAAGLGSALLWPGTAQAGGHGRGQRVVLPFRHRLRGCKHLIEKLVVLSKDRRLIAFLTAKKERRGIYTVLLATLKAYKCADLHSAKRLGIMQQALGKALAARYRTRTRRRTAAPAVTIIVGQIQQRPPLDGESVMPTAPVPPIKSPL